MNEMERVLMIWEMEILRNACGQTYENVYWRIKIDWNALGML